MKLKLDTYSNVQIFCHIRFLKMSDFFWSEEFVINCAYQHIWTYLTFIEVPIPNFIFQISFSYLYSSNNDDLKIEIKDRYHPKKSKTNHIGLKIHS